MAMTKAVHVAKKKAAGRRVTRRVKATIRRRAESTKAVAMISLGLNAKSSE
jgi:hypothetical protein